MSSVSTGPVDGGNKPGAATETAPPASVGGSKRSIGTSEASLLPYPYLAATEDGFHNNWGVAKPSNPGLSSGSSQSNGERFRRLRILAHGVILSLVEPHTAMPVRFDFYSDQSGSEAVPTKKENCEMRGDGVETQIRDPKAV
ncbi:MAG: hypothetical protein WBB42_09215 [Polyangiales bacterium]